MPTLEVDAVRAHDVTFVSLLLEADSPHRVRVACRHDGPVWPPREDGHPAPGWDDDGATVRVEAGVTPLGYATSVEPEVVAVALVEETPLASGLPEGVRSWVRRVEARVEAAERLADADDLPTATRAVASVGGLAAVESLAGDLARDRRLLARVDVAPADLRARLEAVDVPRETFARLAAAGTD